MAIIKKNKKNRNEFDKLDTIYSKVSYVNNLLMKNNKQKKTVAKILGFQKKSLDEMFELKNYIYNEKTGFYTKKYNENEINKNAIIVSDTIEKDCNISQKNDNISQKNEVVSHDNLSKIELNDFRKNNSDLIDFQNLDIQNQLIKLLNNADTLEKISNDYIKNKNNNNKDIFNEKNTIIEITKGFDIELPEGDFYQTSIRVHKNLWADFNNICKSHEELKSFDKQDVLSKIIYEFNKKYKDYEVEIEIEGN